jgi:hypothetical protein
MMDVGSSYDLVVLTPDDTLKVKRVNDLHTPSVAWRLGTVVLGVREGIT